MLRESMRTIFVGLLIVAAIGIVRVSEAAPITFTAVLDGASENPPNASPGTGTATVIIDLDTGFSTVGTMRVMAEFENLIGNTTAAHIHCCTPPPNNAGVATQVPLFEGFPLAVTSGSYDHTFDLADEDTFNPTFLITNGGTAEGATAALVAGLQAGQAYFNIHTDFVTAGEIRGFLTAEQDNSVPEPGMVALLALMAWGTWFAIRRRH